MWAKIDTNLGCSTLVTGDHIATPSAEGFYSARPFEIGTVKF